ncbi:sensor histidine kinase [Sporosalibacterium faouarense]|uniref:sensor histidine kinase n=1 Tax=Sporosalibacterium faouarense TaxID=516123 RepID=UPI00192B9CD3|nr:sensor histidine kinase [Sporosalibacterium faouarense]
MGKLNRFNYILRNIVMVAIVIGIYTRYKEDTKSLIIYVSIFAIILVNDYIRHNGIIRKKRLVTISLLLSIIAGGILGYFARGYSDIYPFMLTYEIIMFYNDGLGRALLSFNIITMIFSHLFDGVELSQIFLKSFWIENILDILMFVFLIASVIIFILYLKLQVREKNRIQKLNTKLNESYQKLQEYSNKIEELTISKERNRVAQEIHDSLGHSLTALIMHLDFLEKITNEDDTKSRKLIIKTQEIARSSMKDLRKAVFALKEEKSKLGFLDSLEELKNDLTINEALKINYDLGTELEKISPDLKNVIYITIKEALTNSIKHSNSTMIDIICCIKEHYVSLEINDNGVGCEEIIYGNGLDGINNRISIVGGNVKLNSSKDKGFSIAIFIPLREGGKSDEANKSDVS